MTRTQGTSARVAIASLCIVGLACRPAGPSAANATADIDSLNAALVRAYRTHDPQAYAALYTDTAVFEWPAFNTVRGPAQLAAMARSNWASLKDKVRSEEHTSELQSREKLVCRLLLEKKNA